MEGAPSVCRSVIFNSMWCLALAEWLLEFSVSPGVEMSGKLTFLEVLEFAQFCTGYGLLLESLLLYGPFYGL